MKNTKDYLNEIIEIMVQVSGTIISDEEYLDFLEGVIKEAKGRHEATKADSEPIN